MHPIEQFGQVEAEIEGQQRAFDEAFFEAIHDVLYFITVAVAVVIERDFLAFLCCATITAEREFGWVMEAGLEVNRAFFSINIGFRGGQHGSRAMEHGQFFVRINERHRAGFIDAELGESGRSEDFVGPTEQDLGQENRVNADIEQRASAEFWVENPRIRVKSGRFESKIGFYGDHIADFARLGLSRLDNTEGMCWGPALPGGSRTLVCVSDDNFNPLQATQFVAFEYTENA